MFKILSKKAFASITEIIVTAIVFVVSSIGILSAITMVRPKGGDAVKRFQAAYIAKSMVDQIRSEIDGRTWNNSADIIPGGVQTRTFNPSSTNDTYTVKWKVRNVSDFVSSDGYSYLRELELNVIY